MRTGSFQGTLNPAAPSDQDTLFSRAAEAIGAGVVQITQEIMPDIRAKLIDEAWFGRPAYPNTQSLEPNATDIWRSPGLVIEGQWHAQEPPDLTPER